MAHDGKFAQYIRRKHIHWMVAAVLCALVALLVLRRIQMPADVPLPQVPVSDPQPKTPYSIPIENTKLYVYVSGESASDSEESTTYPEEAAVELAKSFLDDLMTPSDARTFTITEYRDLKVRLLPTTDMDRESADIYVLRPSEISKDTWIVEIDVSTIQVSLLISDSFQYEGVISPIGSADQRWIDSLYQGSPIGFLLTRNGTEYTMRSRYSGA